MPYLRYLKICAVVTLLLIACFPYWQFYLAFKRPIPIDKQAPEALTIDRATSAQQFANLLAAKHWIDNPRSFLILIRLKGLSHSLKAGVYQIDPGETPLSLLHKVATGDVLKLRFTIVAGWQQSTLDKALQKAPHLIYQPSAWAAIAQKQDNAEGLVLAETYTYTAGSTSRVVLEQANKQLMQYLDASWASRDADLPYKSAYDMLTAASIIEKESAIPAERKLIAGVLVNRIKKGMPLQMDPTVIYGLGLRYKGHLSHQDMLVDSPYNSYLHRGLPPTPIAMVGKEALDAAAHPVRTNYLYFVAKGNGKHQFSETYLQQRQAIKQYLHKGS